MKKLITKVTKPINSINAYLPENLDVDNILSKYQMTESIHNNHKARIYFILDSLYHISFNRKWKEFFEEKGGYPLQANILKKLLGNQYVTSVKILIENGVLERSRSYKVGEQSKLFRFAKEYTGVDFKIRSISKSSSPTIFKKLLSHKQAEDKKNNLELKKIPHITKWFDTGLLSIDYVNADAFVETYYNELNHFTPKVLPKKRSFEEMESRKNYRVNNLLEVLWNLKERNYMLSMRGEDHRLHSILSAAKKELRTLFTYDSKPLVSIDLKASQPYLLAYICRPEYWKEEFKIDIPELATYMRGSKLQDTLSHILMFPVFSESQYSIGLHSDTFSTFPWSEDFYQHLVNKAAQEKMEHIFPDRPTTKHKIMMILYDDGSYKDNEPAFKLFQKWYPKEAKMIVFFKNLSRKAKARSSSGIVNYLPILLQRLESRLILHQVTKVISKKLPSAPLFTVHDCVLTTNEHSEKVQSILEKELEAATGIKPGLTIEKYDHQKTHNEIVILAMFDMDEIIGSKQMVVPFEVKRKQRLIPFVL